MLDEPGDYDRDEGFSVFDRAAEEGEPVFCHHWCANRPGGSGSEWVYLLDGQFYYLSEDFEPGGPYASLDEALDANEALTEITGCTVSIASSLLSDDAIVDRIGFSQVEAEYDASIAQMTGRIPGIGGTASEDLRPALTDEDEYLVDGKQFRINRTRYEFRAPATLIPMGPAQDQSDVPDGPGPWDAGESGAP